MNHFIGITMKTYTPDSCRVYAIRVGTVIEFRVSQSPLKVKFSSLTRTIKCPKELIRYAPIAKHPFYAPVYSVGEKRLTLKQVTYTGGKVLGCCKATAFQRLLGLPLVKSDDCVRLPMEQAALVLSKDWRRKHLC